MSEAATIIRERLARHGAAHPHVALVLGSGLGALVGDVERPLVIPYDDLPGFPRLTTSSHAGEVVIGQLNGVAVLLLAGRGHYYERGEARAMAGAIESVKALGIETLILTNAAGSLREDMPPGTPMLITDHINFAGVNPLIGTPGDGKFTNLVGAYDPMLREACRAAALKTGIALAEGVYMWFSGPSFETPAEIRMARTLGADAVGMSTVPETILARHHGLRVIGLSLITNLAAGMSGEALSHEETKREAGKAAEAFGRLVKTIIPMVV